MSAGAGFEPIDLVQLLTMPHLTTTLWVAAAIVCLAPHQFRNPHGEALIEVRTAVQSVRSRESRMVLRVHWSLDALEAAGYGVIRRDVAALAESHEERRVTELAAIGLAVCAIRVFLPTATIWKVAAFRDRGDFYLNGSYQEMVEVSGMSSGDLVARFRVKRRQILANRNLKRAYVNVTAFHLAQAMLRRVR
jgi:hypothetical protein